MSSLLVGSESLSGLLVTLVCRGETESRWNERVCAQSLLPLHRWALPAPGTSEAAGPAPGRRRFGACWGSGRPCGLTLWPSELTLAIERILPQFP